MYLPSYDHAYDLSLGDAMVYGADIRRRHRSPSAEAVAERRLLVQQRARNQMNSQGQQQ